MNMRMLLIVGALAALHLPATVTAAEPPTGAAGNQASAVKRTILRRVDVPSSNYEVVLVIVEVPADTSVGRHTHPGTVVGYVIEGEYTMLIDGRPPQSAQAGGKPRRPKRRRTRRAHGRQARQTTRRIHR